MPTHRHQLRPADTPSPAGGKLAEGTGGQDAYVYSEYTGILNLILTASLALPPTVTAYPRTTYLLILCGAHDI